MRTDHNVTKSLNKSEIECTASAIKAFEWHFTPATSFIADNTIFNTTPIKVTLSTARVSSLLAFDCFLLSALASFVKGFQMALLNSLAELATRWNEFMSFTECECECE